MVGGTPGLKGPGIPFQIVDLDTNLLGLSILVWVILLAVVGVMVGVTVFSIRRRRRKRLVGQLQRQRQAMERASKDLFSERRADEIRETVRDAGKPTTVVEEGLVAYTDTGEKLVFKSSSAASADDAVASAVGGRKEVPGTAPPTWAPSYRIEEVIALHITGVAMFAVDPTGKVKDGRDLDPELLMVLERLLEEARWLGGEMVTAVYHDRTVSLTWGEDIHMAAVVDGDPDERLDRELRWAIGDLVEEYSNEIWSWGEDTDPSVPRTLTSRISSVFNLTSDIKPGELASQSQGGGLRVTSTVSWRNSMAEYTLGIINNGPGPVRDVELLPSLSREGRMDVVTVLGLEVDTDNRFRTQDIPQGHKKACTFVFRVHEPMEVRVDCTVVYRRGVANLQDLRVPGRWIELERTELKKGEHVEPERALELATQPATFKDRCAMHVHHGMDPETLFNKVIENIKLDMDPVVELEDDDMTQLEAWFHAEVMSGGTVVASLTAMPKDHILDLFVSSTIAGAVPGTMTILKSAVRRAARQNVPEVLDPELRSIVPRAGVLLFQSWGFFDE